MARTHRERLQQAIATLQAHPRYSALAALSNDVYGRRSVNPLLVLSDCLSENPFSRLLHYLFDSDASHRLGCGFYSAWAREAGLPNQFYLATRRVRPLLQWRTAEGRYLDLLLEIWDGRGCLRIVGIENKLWSGEQERQLVDYQAAIAQAYPEVANRILVYLTPNRRGPQTADLELSAVPIAVVGYASIVAATTKIDAGDTEARTFLDQLGEYVSSQFISKEQQMQAARELVAELIRDSATHKAIDLIRAAYGEALTVRNFFYEKVIAELRQKRPLSRLVWHHPSGTPWPGGSISTLHESRAPPLPVRVMSSCC